MKIFKYIFTALVVIFSLNSAGFAQMFSFEKNPNIKSATFTAGTLFKGVLQNKISSADSNIGDKVYVLIPFNVKIGEVTCIPKRSMVTGQIIQAQKAQQGKNGFIQIKFDSIQFPDGWGTQLSGHVWNGGGNGIIGGETTKRIDYRKTPHYIANVGAVVQLVETGKRAMGQEKSLPIGTELIIVLDNDLNVMNNLNL